VPSRPLIGRICIKFEAHKTLEYVFSSWGNFPQVNLDLQLDIDDDHSHETNQVYDLLGTLDLLIDQG
jgi:hypothetical protein